jgi:DNA polymerase-3 subunit beta
LPEVVLQRLLAFTLPAVSVDESRYVLNGIYLARGAGLRAVGTDGRRLTLMTLVDADFSSDEEPWEIILPTKAASLVAGAAAVDDKASVVMWGFRDDAGKWLAVEVELASGLVVQAKLISGQYPNYAQVIPDKTLEQVTVNGQALAEMCGRAGVINADSVCIVMEDREVVVSSEMIDVGRWREEDEIVADDGQPSRRVEVQLNPAYVGVLALGVSGRLDVGHARNAGPLVWRASVPAGEEELRLTGVLMPIRKEGGEE